MMKLQLNIEEEEEQIIIEEETEEDRLLQVMHFGASGRHNYCVYITDIGNGR